MMAATLETAYAPRDGPLLDDRAFDYVVLDESQAIKNAGTASAKAARLFGRSLFSGIGDIDEESAALLSRGLEAQTSDFLLQTFTAAIAFSSCVTIRSS
jgi:hypothetical protein